MLELTKNTHRFFISWLQDNADENWNILLYHTKGLRKVSVISKFFLPAVLNIFQLKAKIRVNQKVDVLCYPGHSLSLTKSRI